MRPVRILPGLRCFAIKKLWCLTLFFSWVFGFASLLGSCGDIFIFGHLVGRATSSRLSYFATTRGFFA